MACAGHLPVHRCHPNLGASLQRTVGALTVSGGTRYSPAACAVAMPFAAASLSSCACRPLPPDTHTHRHTHALISTSTHVCAGLRSGKPPTHPGGRGSSASHRMLRHGPPVIRNPYLTPGNDNAHLFHPPSGQGCSRADVLPPRQNRLT